MNSRILLIASSVSVFFALCACVSPSPASLPGPTATTVPPSSPTPEPTLPSPTATSIPLSPPTLDPTTSPATEEAPAPSLQMIIPALSLRLAIPVEEVIAINPIPDGRLTLLTLDGRSDFLDIQTGEIEKGLVAPIKDRGAGLLTRRPGLRPADRVRDSLVGRARRTDSFHIAD